MLKYSKAEAGKLGAEKSKITTALKKKERIDQYSLNPKHCKQCNKVLEYKDRNKTFCNSSCSATFNNLKRTDAIRKNPTKYKEKRVPVKWNCLNCNKEHTTVAWRIGKYCNTDCQHEYEYKQRLTEWLVENKKIGKNAMKRYLTETHGYKCSVCSISEWNNKKIVLELEHIDGNSDNNNLENICLICPNCHSQTDTYKGKNVGQGRHYRRVRYAEGKSF